MSDPTNSAVPPAPAPPAPSIAAQAKSAALSTIVEGLDSKKATASIAGVIATVLVTIAGRQGWTWLDPATADALSLKLVGLVLGYVLAQAHVDNAKEKAKA